MKGTLASVRSDPSNPLSKTQLKFMLDVSYNDSQCGQITELQQVALDRNRDGASGAGKVAYNLSTGSSQCPNSAYTFNVAYNAGDFYRKMEGGASYCLSRTNYEESAWSYGLYDWTGKRVIRNSGFPITFTSSNGGTGMGWVGYWGLWTNNNETLTDGMTVNKVDYNNGTQTSILYTLVNKGGKLKKHTRTFMTLDNIKNIPMSYGENNGNTYTNYQVIWDGTNFTKNAVWVCGTNNCNWSNLTPTQTIDLTMLNWNELSFWSDSLNGQVRVKFADSTGKSLCKPYNLATGTYDCSAAISPTLPVVVYLEDLVYPGDLATGATITTLVCYFNCPDPTLFSSITTTTNGNAYFTSNATGTSQFVYTIDPTEMILKSVDAGNVPVLLTGTILTSQYQNGVWSGVLSEPTQTNLDLLKCDWDPTQICGWKADSALPVYYTWETGPSTWNHFTGLMDTSNAFVKFDPPLQVQYKGSGDPYGSYDTIYRLQYSGFGRLDGIPGKCVNLDTGGVVDCSLSNGSKSIRWVPQFIIPPMTDGYLTALTDDKLNEYYVKPLEISQRMKQDLNINNCIPLMETDFSGYILPDISIWSDPVPVMGQQPVVTDPPAVIGGVTQ